LTVETSPQASAAALRPLQQIDAGLLNVGYVDLGPVDGPAVLLLHGWPYDIHSYVDVAPALAAAGYRAIVPYLRGYGSTRFRSDETVRNGEQAALAVDAIDFLDALKIEKAIVAGCDWGARTACIVAALWPERCDGLVSVSGYLIGSQAAGKLPLPLRPSISGGTSTTSRPSAARPVTTSTGATLQSSSGGPRRRNGTSTTPRSIAAPRPSTTRITSRSRSTTTDGDWG
jgi:pimeloyl-ACP methyl ester carboxylesterase